MTYFRRIFAIVTLAGKRLLAQRGLVLATCLGFLIAIALATSIPMYADAVYARLLQESLDPQEENAGKIPRPPFSFIFRYTGDWSGPLQWEDIRPVDEYLSGSGPASLGVPLQYLVRKVKTDTFALYPEADTAYADQKQPLLWVRFAFQSDVQDHITLVEGRLPSGGGSTPNSPVEVMLSDDTAQKLGIQVGEEYTAFNPRAKSGIRQTRVRITGIWRPTDPLESYWYATPPFSNDLLVPEEIFSERISATLEDEVNGATWYLAMDGAPVHTDRVSTFLARIQRFQLAAGSLLPKLVLESSPVEALEKYRDSARVLTVQLYAFCVPILGLILAFVALVAELMVVQQRNEIAILRSRGATSAQVVGISLLQEILMGIATILLGVPAGALIALLIGQSRSFLDFSERVQLPVRIGFSAFLVGIGVVLVAILIQVIPLLGAARHTIITYKQERARSLRPPLWKRLGLDFLLLLPVGYGIYTLQRQGSILLPGNYRITLADPFQNPLLLLLPALTALASALLLLRLLPWFMSAVAWVAERTNAVGLVLAAQHLARTPGLYAAPLILIVMTVSLSTFTASLAQTLEDHLTDQAYYQVGADLNLDELGENLGQFSEPAAGFEQGTDGPAIEDPGWVFLPVSEHLKLPGVTAAARVGRYPAVAHPGSGSFPGTFLGIDRVDFPAVAFWRRDFAFEPLGGLMNALAMDPDGVLLPGWFLAQNGLAVGDPIQVAVEFFGKKYELEFKVAGSFNLFPTWYPDKGILVVGSLDSLFEQVGGQYPYEVWLKTQPGVDEAGLIASLRNLSVRVVGQKGAPGMILTEQQKPDRQGLFGVLSVGFVAAALVTVLGFLLYALFTFQQRFIELGVLRAIGLSIGQMVSFLSWELAFLLITGLGFGTALGVWMSNRFIPSLQIGADAASRIPPYSVEIAWVEIFRIYSLFGLLFVTALVVLGGALVRMKIFQAVKLGETV